MDPAQLVYTSGSTGQPKGVLVGHGNLWAGALTVARYLDVRPEDRIASVLPFGFVYGLNQLMCALVSGATLVVQRATLPEDMAAALADDRITVLATVPPAWLQLLQAPGVHQGAARQASHPDLRRRAPPSRLGRGASTGAAAGSALPDVRPQRSVPEHLPPAR